MKHYLLNHQPQKELQAACAQQGQAPTCNARGKGHTSASPKTLTKVILVLLTMFLLPSAAWGEDSYLAGVFNVTTDIKYKWYIGSKDSYYWETTFEAAADNNVTEGVYCTGQDDNSQALQIYRTPGDFNAPLTFTNKSNSKSEDIIFKLSEPRNVCIKSVTISLNNFSDGVSITANEDSFNSITSGDNTLTLSQPHLWNDEFSITLSLPASGYVEISTIKITTETYLGVTVADVPVTYGVNENDILGDGKVSFTAASGTNPAILTLKNATLGSYESNCQIISYLDNLTINLEGTNTIHGGISLVENAEGTLNFTGSSGSSLTINNVQNGGYSGTAIKRFTSVNFGSFNLSSSSAPGVYYKTDKDDSNSYQLWTNHIGGGGYSVSNVTLTTQTLYNLWVGNRKEGTSTQIYTQVTADNKSAILGDSKISFDGSQTLTLSGAELTGSIISGLNALTIIVDEVNTINTSYDSLTCIRNIAPGASLTLQKSTNGTPSLSLTGGSVIGNFSTINYAKGGLYLHAYSGSDPAPDAYFSYEGLVGATKAEFTTESLDYILKIGDTSINESVTINSGDKVDDAITDGSITFSIDENNNGILTLDNVMLSNDVNNKILSYLPSLTINIKGSCEIGKVISTYSNATLTLGLAKGADDESKLTTQIGSQRPFWEGFAGTPTFKDNLCFLPNDDKEVVEKLPTPYLSIVDGGLEIELYGSNLDQMHKFYSVDFVEGNDVELKEYNSDSPETIDKPCTVTAYTEFEDVFGVKRQSEPVTGKYFGIADKTIVFNNETKGSELKIDDLEIIPATKDEGVSFSFRGVDKSDVIMPSQEGNGYKLSIAGIGRCEVSMEISVANPTIQVLNPFEDSDSEVKYAKGVVTVLPDKPTIEKEDKDYLDTDKITITRTSVEGEVANDINIFYTWSDDVEVEAYQLYVDGGSVSIYNPDEPIAAQTGTLRAWVGYNAGDNYYYNSKVASEIFEVKKDIASCTVTLPENAIYRGSAYEPVVKESTTATTPLSLGTDYTLSYQKVEGETTSDIESMIDAGTYKITITGAGDFGGTSEVANFQIGQASLADASITTLIVGDKEYEYDADKGFEIPYTGEAIQPNVVVTYTYNDETITVDASEYVVSYGDNNTEVSGESETEWASVTVTSTDKNFTAETYKTQNFKIVPAPVTITAENQTVTYNADKQEYDISKVEVSNNNAKLAITYYAKEEDRSKGENALTEAPTNADTYYVRVTLNEESQQHYVANPADATFTIDQLELTNAEITLDNTELTYNGEAQTVSVTEVKVGELVVPTECYEVSDNTATEAGTYTAKVTAKTTNADGSTFKNNFKGSATVDWKINHRTASAAELGFTSETQTASTYYNPDEAFNLPEGYVGYIVTGTNGTNVLTTRVSYIPKGVAVLVEKGSSSANAIDEAPDPANLPLKGTSEPLEVSSIAGGTVYVLYNGEFVKSTSGTIPGKRCYLLIDNSVAAGTRAFGINHNKGANGIESALFDDNNVKADDKWFDLQGRRIEKPTKAGIYVVNGKKVMINNK